jgi:hypothetical protein
VLCVCIMLSCSDSVLVPCWVPYQRCVYLCVWVCMCGCSYALWAQLPAAVKNIRRCPRELEKFLCSYESCKCTDYDILSYKLWPHGYVMWRRCYQSDKWYNKKIQNKAHSTANMRSFWGMLLYPRKWYPWLHGTLRPAQWSSVKRWNPHMPCNAGILKHGTCQIIITFPMAVLISALPAVF